MEQEKKDLLATIQQNYTGAHEMNIENSVAFTANIRATLEAAVKLFWKEKLGYIPSWTRGSKEIFITGQAVRSPKFTAFFERWALKEMEYICDACGDSVHGENMSIDTANELISSLDKSLRAMEKILGFLIIPAIKNEEIQNDTTAPKPIETVVDFIPTNPLLNKTVNHWIYGEGKIIKVVGDRMTVQFAKKQEEYGQESLKNGFLKLVDVQKTKVESPMPQTYVPNVPEVKQVFMKTTKEIDEINKKLLEYKSGSVDKKYIKNGQIFAKYENEFIAFDCYETSNKQGITSKMWSFIYYCKKDFQHFKSYNELTKITRIKVTKVRDDSNRWAIRFYDMVKNPDPEFVIEILNYIFSEQ